jgi:hypothetical protein
MSNLSNTVMDGNEGFKTLQHLIQRPPAPKPVVEPSRYPLCMVDPDHQEAVPPEYHEKVVNREHLFGPGIERYMVPGSPERYPHRIVHDEEPEAAAIADGYRAPGVTHAPVAREVPDNFKPTCIRSGLHLMTGQSPHMRKNSH